MALLLLIRGSAAKGPGQLLIKDIHIHFVHVKLPDLPQRSFWPAFTKKMWFVFLHSNDFFHKSLFVLATLRLTS